MSVLIATYAEQGRDVVLAADCLRSEWDVTAGRYQPKPGNVHKVHRVSHDIGMGIAGIAPFSKGLNALVSANRDKGDWLAFFQEACPRIREDVRHGLRKEHGERLSKANEERILNDIAVFIGGRIGGRRTIHWWCEESDWEFEEIPHRTNPFGILSPPPGATQAQVEAAKAKLRTALPAELKIRSVVSYFAHESGIDTVGRGCDIIRLSKGFALPPAASKG